MKHPVWLLLCIIIISCGTPSEKDTTTNTHAPIKEVADFNVATTFINDYVRFLSKYSKDEADTTQLNWIMQHSLLTDRFKSTYKNLLDPAKKADPELGLDFDPILDAQDFPESGYEIKKRDTLNNYVIITAREYGTFHLAMKLVKENNKWLIDGSGVINIPLDKRVPQ
jgi:hypothetical protein